ncbi:MAG: MotA/TolQ/ExbB proton channel family protein [Rhizobacter sp.]|nr:MotA/TolQ/ExbB proton channel family protein [Chlorobiales bacterium]
MASKNKTFLWITIFIALAVAFAIFYFVFRTAETGILHELYKGGPLVAVLMTCFLVLVTVVIERTIAYNKAEGKGDLPNLMKAVKQDIERGAINEALQKCEKHNSAVSTAIMSGLERYRSLDEVEPRFNAKIQEVQKAIDEAANFESSQYETNLTPIKTIATIATLIGLLGTTVGMINAFSELSKSGGSADASKLSGAISEALFNTAGGLGTAIIATVAMNYFKARIDDFTYFIDEAAFEIVQTLTISRKNLISERERQQS